MAVTALFSLASCGGNFNPDSPPVPAQEKNTILLRLGSFPLSVQTKAHERGVNYNENLIESVDLFFYPEGGTGSNAVIKALGRGVEAKAEADSIVYAVSVHYTEAQATALFGGVTDGATCQVYAVANASLTYGADTKVETLKNTVIERDFSMSEIQNSFLMSSVGTSTVTLAVDSEGSSASGRVPVKRAAAKAQLFLNLPESLPDPANSNRIWKPDVAKAHYSNGVYVDLVNLSKKGKIDGDYTLAEADYILKYVDSDFTQDITALGVTDFSNAYKYTVQAASDADGVVKGVSFQCCPSALIYRRSIAKDVLGTDDPAEVQAALDSWDKFNAVAADAKAKGYYMTASFAETFRPFSNNCTMPWVDEDNNLQLDPQIAAWMAQTDEFIKNGYTLTAGVWDDEKNVQMFADGKTMCFFGPAWYFNFCMGNAQDPEKGCYGDWAICEGPMAHFWGGTWLLAATGSDNPTMLADVMNTFINDEDVCSKLVSEQAQFSNNQAVNAKFAEDPEFGSEFLGGQNDTAVFSVMTDNGKYGWCKVTVTRPLPTAIALPKNATVGVGASVSLTPTFTPEGAGSELTWSVDDESIAKVDANGVVTGVCEGLTVVTATTSNGIVSNPCKITVTRNADAIQDVNKDSNTVSRTYNVSGQRIAVPRKGINIVGGKKVIVK